MAEDLKAALLRICTPAAPILLGAPPLVEHDLGVALICPACQSIDTARQIHESVLMGVCYACGCNFTRPTESVSRQIFQRLAELKGTTMNPLIAKITGKPINEQDEEMLHGAPAGRAPRPRPGQAPALPPEGAAPQAPEGAAAEPPAGAAPGGQPAVQANSVEHWLQIIKQRFVQERVQGFTNPTTGQTYPPVPPEEAEARWLRQEPKFRATLEEPGYLERLNRQLHGGGGGEQEQDQGMGGPEGVAAAASEPAPTDPADTDDLPESRSAAQIAQAKLDE